MRVNGKRATAPCGPAILVGGEYVAVSIGRVVRVLDSIPRDGRRVFTVEAVGPDLPGQRWCCAADELAPVAGRLDGRTPDEHLASLVAALDEATRLVHAVPELLGTGGAARAGDAVGLASKRLIEAGEELAAVAAAIKAA